MYPPSRTAFCRLLYLLLVCAGNAPTAGIAATAPSPRGAATLNSQQATISNGMYDEFAFDGDHFSCTDWGQVLTGRQRVAGVSSDYTSYQCGIVTYNGVKVEPSDEDEPPYIDARNGEYYPLANRIITRIQISDNNTHRAVHGSSVVVDASGNQLNIRPGDTWYVISNLFDKFQCPANTALVAIRKQKEFLCASIWGGNPPPSGPTGMIGFRVAEQELPCALPVPKGPTGESVTYFLNALDSPCSPNVHESIELEGVPSATRILLTDDDACLKTGNDGHDDFWVELRTTAKSVTMSKIPIDEFFTYSPGAIVRPGLQLVDYYRKGSSEATKKLSCVRVTTSSSPPG
jgi:hypothetical protein